MTSLSLKIKSDYKTPYLIEFAKFGDNEVGYISVAQAGGGIPFEVKRTFWTYSTPENIVRGRHAHYLTEQIILALSGSIVVTAQSAETETETFLLDAPNIGLYVPPNFWHTMSYSSGAVQLVLASTTYDQSDYIRDYNDFVNF